MEWKLRVLDDKGNPIEPKQEVKQEAAQEGEPQQNVEQNEEIRQEEQQQDVQEQSEEQANVQEEKINEATEKPFELDDSSILNYLKERHNKEYDSIEVLLNNETKKQSEELPDDVAKFFEFKKETGRSLSDYAALQQNWADVDDTTAMFEYYKIKKPQLNIDEIKYLIDEKYGYDKEEATEKEKKGKQIAYKEELYEARQYLDGLKEKYKAPLESSEAPIPEEYKKALSFYNEYKEENDRLSRLTEERTNQFQANTRSLFNDEFKGFEFDTGDKKFVFKPSDINKVVDKQLDVNNFYKGHLDENGTVKDLSKYHRDFFAATNADAIFKYAYEQGMADATEGIVKETKNVDMDVRTNTVTDQSGTKFRVVENSDQFSFKIKKR